MLNVIDYNKKMFSIFQSRQRIFQANYFSSTITCKSNGTNITFTVIT